MKLAPHRISLFILIAFALAPGFVKSGNLLSNGDVLGISTEKVAIAGSLEDLVQIDTITAFDEKEVVDEKKSAVSVQSSKHFDAQPHAVESHSAHGTSMHLRPLTIPTSFLRKFAFGLGQIPKGNKASFSTCQ